MKQVHHLPRLPDRLVENHKGDFGKIALLVGSKGMAGAAILAARAALRCGSGLVTIAIESSASVSIPGAVPEATQILIKNWASKPGLGELRQTCEALGKFDAVGLGSGLGRSRERSQLIELILASNPSPHVVDADAINAVAEGMRVTPSPRLVWTPHLGEFRRMTGEAPRSDEERLQAAERFVGKHGGVLLLKGHRTIVHDGDRYSINLTGNPGMATGGSGDVLTGIITSLLGQGLAPFEAAQLGAYLHGLSGDFAARRRGPSSLIAQDLVDALPDAIQFHRTR